MDDRHIMTCVIIDGFKSWALPSNVLNGTIELVQVFDTIRVVVNGEFVASVSEYSYKDVKKIIDSGEKYKIKVHQLYPTSAVLTIIKSE